MYQRRKYGQGGAIANSVISAGLPMLDFAVPGLGTGLSLAKKAFIDPLIAKKQQEELDAELYKQQTEQDMQAGSAYISSYPTQGIRGVSSFAYGGKYKPVYALGGNMVTSPDASMTPLAEGISQAQGQTHENGGIDLDINNDAMGDIEIEDQEVVDENRQYIYSDRLRPSKEEKAMLKSVLGKELNGTFADISAQIAKMRSKYDVNDEDFSNDSPEANTAKLMNERFDEAEEMLIQSQEMQNGGGDQQEFKNGGMYGKRKYNGGGGYVGLTGAGLRKPDQLTAANDLTLPFYNNGVLPSNIDSNLQGDAKMNVNSFNALGANAGINATNTNLVAGNAPASIDLGDLSVDTGKKLPWDLANVANTALNAASIEKLQTQQTPDLVDQPRYIYRDRSPLAISQNRTATRSALSAVGNQQGDVSSSTVGNFLAKELNANNQINNEEAQREVQAQQAYQNARTRVGAINSQMTNQIALDNLNRENDKVSLGVDNRNNLVSSIQQNAQNEQFMQMQGAEALLAAAAGGDTGTISRLFAKYPELLQMLNLKAA